MIKRIFCMGLLMAFSLCVKAHAINEYWQRLNGPYWVNAIDVAYASNYQTQAWHRYLIGTDGSDRKLFYWRANDLGWNFWNYPMPAANKIIAYKLAGYGHIAFCSAFDDRIWKTDNGGASWDWLPGSDQLPNKHFSSIEVPPSSEHAGNVVMVASRAIPNIPSTYYTENGGTNWLSIGSTSSNGLDVYDIEAFQSYTYPPGMSLGTSNGIYVKNRDSWDYPWVQRNFESTPVPVVETIDQAGDICLQVAAVEEGQDGRCNLYYSGGGGDYFPNWWANPVEIRIDGNSFNRVVRDMSAVYWTSSYTSLYVATDEGTFLLTFELSNPSVATMVDLHYAPLLYDVNVQAVDGRFLELSQPDADTFYTLVATNYNVYEIKEARLYPGQISSLSVSEVVAGTYLCNSTAASFPVDDPITGKIFVGTDRGLIKKFDNTLGWYLVGLGFEAGASEKAITDISFAVGLQNNFHVMVSSESASDGRVMYSADYGSHWSNYSPSGSPIVNAVNLDFISSPQLAYAAGEGGGYWSESVFENPVDAVDLDQITDSDEAWAAGTDDYIWLSEDNGEHWNSTGYFSSPHFDDILSDPSADFADYVYVCGSSPKAMISKDNGNSWSTMEEGLPEGTEVRQIARDYGAKALYAATDQGFYKIYDVSSQSLVWSQRSYGMSFVPDLGSVVVDPMNTHALLVSTAPGAEEPHIWASGDSGRSWIELPLGDIPNDASIYKLAASQDAKMGFVALTNMGIFALGDIFKSGWIMSYETWGPGVVIVNGDVHMGAGLTIQAPCTIYVTYDFDFRHEGVNASRAEIRILASTQFVAHGSDEEHIVLTSSRPSEKSEGDWTGLTFFGAGEEGSPTIDMQYVDVEYADKGLFCAHGLTPERISIDHCSFREMTTAGVDLRRTCWGEPAVISNSGIVDCGSYGIRIRGDDMATYLSTTIEGNYIENCDYGIWYSGNSNASLQKVLDLIDNNMIFTTPSPSSQYGIYVTRFSPTGVNPVVKMAGDTIEYYAQGGIWLNFTHGSTSVERTKVYRCGIYGILLSNAMVQIKGQSSSVYSVFDSCQIGVQFDATSTGTVRWTKIKGNTLYGAYIASHDASGAPLPDFGQVSAGQWGNNSIHTNGTASFYHMWNQGNLANVNAIYNWWGGTSPRVRNVNYFPYLLSNPIPKRELATAVLPDVIVLEQNRPNPFNPSTEIAFSLPEPGFVSLKIYGITGQLVKTIAARNFESGEHHVIWSGKNAEGEDVASGVYFVVLCTENGRASRAMTLLR